MLFMILTHSLLKQSLRILFLFNRVKNQIKQSDNVAAGYPLP
jgi:hypothetical protein